MKNRKRKILAVTAAAMLLASGSALATTPTITIDSPADGSSLTFTSFPQTVPVEGTVSRVHTTGGAGNYNLCGVKDLTVTVDDGVDVVEIGYTAEVASGSGTDCPTSAGWDFPWEIAAQGVYTIRATAKAVPSQEEGDAEAEVLVFEEVVTASFPAAPAVAASLLEQAGVSARYGTGKSGGNHIADVAREMGPGTEFHGVAKKDTANYRAAVRAFLVANDALTD